VVAQVRYVLHRRDDAAAAHARELVLQAVDHRRLRARNACQQLGELLCGNLQHGFPPNAKVCGDGSIRRCSTGGSRNLGVKDGRLAPPGVRRIASPRKPIPPTGALHRADPG
jgi:hypothetical protein